MKQRFLFQFIALLLAVLLVVSLTLGLLQKISLLTFWVVAAISIAVAWMLHANPK